MLDFKTLFCEGKIFSHFKSSRNGFEKRFTFWNEYKSKKKVMLETLTYMNETFTKFSVTIELY